MKIRFRVACVAAAAIAGIATQSQAATETFPVTLDRWMYPFLSDGGRQTQSIFSSVPSTLAVFNQDDTNDTSSAQPDDSLMFDDRDAQSMFGFDTSGKIAAGQMPTSYQIASVRMTVKITTGTNIVYDPTYDPVTSYLPSGHASATADTDPGRPIELHGVGYRNGFTQSSFTEFTQHQPTGVGPGENQRNAYAADYNGINPVDVSNNVSGQAAAGDFFDSNAWAIGQTTAAVNTSGAVPGNSIFTFDLNLSDPDVLAYVQRGLAAGEVRFMFTSLHPAAQEGPPIYPAFYSKESENFNAVPASLQITLVPEPTTTAIVVLGAMGAVLRRRRK